MASTSTDSPVAGARARRASNLLVVRSFLARSPEGGAIIGFLAVLLFFSIISAFRDNLLFLQPDSLASILTSQSISGIVAVGVAFLMMTGEFDLSVGSILAVCALVFLWLIMQNVPAVLAAILAVAAGALMGLINGLILVWTRIPSFIVTLGTLQVYRSIALAAISGGRILRYADYSNQLPTVYLHPVVIILIMLAAIGALYFFRPVISTYLRDFRKNSGLGKTRPAITLLFMSGLGLLILGGAVWVIYNQLHDLNTLVPVNVFDFLNGRFDPRPEAVNFRASLIWWVIIVGIFTVILTQLPYGSASLAIGGNAGAARAQGIPVDRIRILNFVICGSLAGLAGIMEVGRAQLVFPNTGTGLELEVIASAVIGGTLLAGGYGSIIGATLGVLITGMLRTGLVQLGVQADWFQGAIGIILIATVVINTAVRRQR
jgi:ribose/xylose/arabinose/galactoside ABC-type transport system permease subunit